MSQSIVIFTGIRITTGRKSCTSSWPAAAEGGNGAVRAARMYWRFQHAHRFANVRLKQPADHVVATGRPISCSSHSQESPFSFYMTGTAATPVSDGRKRKKQRTSSRACILSSTPCRITSAKPSPSTTDRSSGSISNLLKVKGSEPSFVNPTPLGRKEELKTPLADCAASCPERPTPTSFHWRLLQRSWIILIIRQESA